jgi:hypothetical protein
MNRRTLLSAAPLLALALAAACQDAAEPVAPDAPPTGALLARGPSPHQVPPTGKNVGTLTSTVDRTRYRIEYHNGRVMVAGTPSVYFIWYGNWDFPSIQILTDFITSIGGSRYFAINTLYRDASNAAPNGGLIYGGAANDLGSHGLALSDADIGDIVFQAITSFALPEDGSGIYVVVTSADVRASSGADGAGSCAFHQLTNVLGSLLTYIYIGDPNRAPALCMPQTLGPNGTSGADAMASLLANELSNTLTDPNLTAWYDRLGLEQADKCAWTYGQTYPANGALANVRLGRHDYLLQQLWVPTRSGGFCALAAP